MASPKKRSRRRSTDDLKVANVSIGSELKRLFPNGTNPPRAGWTLPPYFPVDVFAAAAHLLQRSGAYAFIVAPFIPPNGDFVYDGPTRASAQSDIDDWRKIGKAWADDPDRWHDVIPFWKKLIAGRRARLAMTPPGTVAPEWWTSAHALLVIADEASEDFGYKPETDTSLDTEEEKNNIRWANGLASYLLDMSLRPEPIIDDERPDDERHISVHVALDSLAIDAERHVARVLPKGRTTEIGCTMRTFSHNLALIPPHGEANAYWHKGYIGSEALERRDLNLLLVPFPYVLPDNSFRGRESESVPGGTRWGRFTIDQNWLAEGDPASFTAFVDALIETAETDGVSVNAVILPEYALDWPIYDALVRHLRDRRHEIEFVVSGISQDCMGRDGNQVAFTVMNVDSMDGKRYAVTHSRRKHHRWCVERTQIEGYALQGDLDVDVCWWEYLAIEQRVLHIDVFRQRSAFTAVICEDLARVDPRLAMLRTLGPNLIFALLMDGAQIPSRWPGVYATGLADDPGSSVLTLTSLALVARSNAVRSAKGETTSRSIGLWKNRPVKESDSNLEILKLPERAHALVLRLASTEATETTMDGRPNNDTSAWYVIDGADNPKAVALSDAQLDHGGWRWITADRGTPKP